GGALVRSIYFTGANDWTSLQCLEPEPQYCGSGAVREHCMSSRTDPAIWSGLFRISTDSGQTLQAQIRQAIVAAILDRQIAASMPLPSCRILAQTLGVPRGTVVLAFQQLADHGSLIAKERRGHFVNSEVLVTPGRIREPGMKEKEVRLDWKARRKMAPSEMPE